jgi:hypothetical protein
MRTAARCAGVFCWLTVTGIWFAAALGAAQDTVSGEAPQAPTAEPVEAPAETAPPSAINGSAPSVPGGVLDLKYLEGPDGRAVYVPNRLRLADFLKFEAAREAGAGARPPQASIASIAFDGRADDERAYLTAIIDVDVAADNAWVSVPLLMTEGTLRAPAVYSGKGLAIPAPYQPDGGYTWWIKGKGTHQLKLSLSIPLRKQAAQRRVQLTLPPTVVSGLKLRVATPRVSAKAPERAFLSTKLVGQETEIEVIGLGTRLDVSWQAIPESNAAATALEVTTTVVATLVDGEAATLEATQLIQSLGQQGSFGDVRVSPPAGYELLRLEGPDVRDHRTDPANPRQTIVQLKGPTAGPVELKWTVRADLPAVGETFALEGFEVERARLQTGYLAVIVVGDFHIIRQPDEDKFLQRVELADLPGALRQAPASAAFRFLDRLLLRMKLQRVEPYVTVDPAILVHLARDAIDLEAICRVQVLRGSITSFRLRWPRWKQQQWTIPEAELPGHVELRTAEEPGDADVLRLEFPEPLKGMIDLRFRARRPLAEGSDRPELTLPVPDAYGRSPAPTRLALVSADNVDADLRPAETTVLRAIGSPDPRISVPEDWQTLKRTDYRVESPQSEFLLGLAVHPRKIQGATHVDASIGRSAVTVRQTVVYDVAYERLSQLRFAIPDGVPAEQLRFFSRSPARPNELAARVAPATGQSPAEIRVTLSVPAIGRFEVEVGYALPRGVAAPDSRETRLLIPLLQSNDVVYSSTRFSCRDASGRDVLVEGDGWARQLDADGLPVWVLGEARAQVAVQVAHRAGAPLGALVSRALIRTRLSPDGTSQNWAQYRVAEGVSELSVTFPPHLKPVGFWWNRDAKRVEAAGSTADGTAWYDIDISGRAADDRLLTIEFLARPAAPGRLGAGFALETPWLSEDQSPAQVRWQVELPHHQHLFVEPAGFSPEYRWHIGRLFFSREPQWSSADLEQWIGAGSGPAVAAAGDGNHYVFSAFGPPGSLDFRAMSQSGLVLIGAGTALLLGLVLVKWPRTRHVVTLLTVAFVVALMGVWFAAPVQVLLQPAVLGVLLAMMAAAIDGFVKRRARPVTVTFTSSSGFMTPASSHPGGPAAGPGDFTRVRTPPPPTRPAGQLSESGARK